MEADLNFLFLQNLFLANRFILRSVQPTASSFWFFSFSNCLMFYVQILQMDIFTVRFNQQDSLHS